MRRKDSKRVALPFREVPDNAPFIKDAYRCGMYSDTENRLKYSFQSVFNAVSALHFRDDKGSIAKIRLVPITVSQLKCALHILIGDWYERYTAVFFFFPEKIFLNRSDLEEPTIKSTTNKPMTTLLNVVGRPIAIMPIFRT